MSELGVEDVAVLETIEMDAWESMFGQAPGAVRQGLGLHLNRFGPALATASAAVDVGQFNRIQGIGLAGDEEGGSIAASVAWFRGLGVRNFLVQIPPGPRAADFQAAAGKLGLTLFRRSWTKFRRAPLPHPLPKTSLDIVRAGASEAADFGATAAAGFGMPPVMGQWLAALVIAPGWRCYVSYDGDRPMGVGAYWLGSAGAWIGIGATRPEGRGRGSQSAILARRINDAISEGASLLVTETGSAVPGEPQTSFDNILKAGFEIAYERPNWTGP